MTRTSNQALTYFDKSRRISNLIDRKMKEVTNLTQELLNDILPTEKETQEHLDNLKPEINNLLHTYLPDDITLKEAGVLGMVIWEILTNPNRFLTPPEQ